MITLFQIDGFIFEINMYFYENIFDPIKLCTPPNMYSEKINRRKMTMKEYRSINKITRLSGIQNGRMKLPII